MSNLDPDMRVERIQDIDLPLLWSQGIRGLIFDLDNTITPWHQYAANDEIIRWFEQVRQYGFQACILSNSGEAKTAQISEWLDVPVLSDSRKPRAYGFRRAGRLLQLPPRHLAMIGDQIFTDIWGANNAGIESILVEPIDKNTDIPRIRIKRWLEKPILCLYKKGFFL